MKDLKKSTRDKDGKLQESGDKDEEVQTGSRKKYSIEEDRKVGNYM